MRMEVAHDITDDAGALAIGAGGPHARVVHAKEHPPVHGLQPVSYVRQSAADYDAHGVVEIRGPHLVRDLYLLHAAFESLHGSVPQPTRPGCARSARSR